MASLPPLMHTHDFATRLVTADHLEPADDVEIHVAAWYAGRDAVIASIAEASVAAIMGLQRPDSACECWDRGRDAALRSLLRPTI